MRPIQMEWRLWIGEISRGRGGILHTGERGVFSLIMLIEVTEEVFSTLVSSKALTVQMNQLANLEGCSELMAVEFPTGLMNCGYQHQALVITPLCMQKISTVAPPDAPRWSEYIIGAMLPYFAVGGLPNFNFTYPDFITRMKRWYKGLLPLPK